jgi:hypothetical protein
MGFKDAGKPHFLGHRDRLRQRFRDLAATRYPTMNFLNSSCSARFCAATPSRWQKN